MKYAKYLFRNKIYYGIVNEDKISELNGDPFEEYDVTGKTVEISEVKLLSPTLPSKILAIGLNYRSHLGKVSELGDRDEPSVPEPFLKAPTSVINPGESIVLPKDSTKVQEEGEMVVIIKDRCKNVSRNEAKNYILGYTCGNDVSDRNWQANDLQWWRAKSSDTFAPMGPFIETDIDSNNVMLRALVNGAVVQESNTSYLIHDVSSIIEHISRVITLEPGDAIFTGTPGSPVDIHPGDTVEVEIDGIGILSNPVVSE
jgi:2-keto-4-pentenoate hydratase/2-oxohepta-3-ene-1,7-dioic acid hydratase in catechol pathway